MPGLDLKLDDSDGKGETFGVSVDVRGRPKPGQAAEAAGAFIEVEGKGDWDKPSYWRKVGRALKNFFRR